jgi:hypothetical protein
MFDAVLIALNITDGEIINEGNAFWSAQECPDEFSGVRAVAHKKRAPYVRLRKTVESATSGGDVG